MPDQSGAGGPGFSDAQIERFNQDADLYQIALDEARRALDSQLAELGNLRTRAVQFLAFIGSATGFMVGASKFSGQQPWAWFHQAAWVATILSFATVLAIALLLNPWTTRLQRIDIDDLLDTINVDVGRLKKGGMLREMAIALDILRENNEPKISRVRWLYLSVIGFGMLQLAAWAVLVWHVPK